MTDLVPIPGSVTETELRLDENLPFDRWVEIGETLGSMSRACAWWIGDWLNYGEDRYGETYAQGMEATGLAYQTLANYAWVARKIPPHLRRRELSWTHHLQVASGEISDELVEEYLDNAVAGGWSSSELREEIVKDGYGKSARPPRARWEETFCERCGKVVKERVE